MSRLHPAILAVIREAECIGCTKCIQACPFDAIIGAHNLMHTVIADACNGCKLCVEPCPVDCIDLIELPERSAIAKRALAEQSRDRFKKHKARLARDEILEQEQYLQTAKSIDARKAEIQAAMARMKK
jgi:electron transport complex protein RnfB